jgi:hypothetical protein
MVLVEAFGAISRPIASLGAISNLVALASKHSV